VANFFLLENGGNGNSVGTLLGAKWVNANNLCYPFMYFTILLLVLRSKDELKIRFRWESLSKDTPSVGYTISYDLL